MPTLTLMFDDIVRGKYSLGQKGEVLTIGRKPNNDVSIDNMAVSGQHAKIEFLDQGFLLTDLKSKNGTFVNGRLVTSHWLNNRDIIQIGKHTLVFFVSEGEMPDDDEDMSERTVLMDTDKHRYMMGAGAPAAPQQVQATEKKDFFGVLSLIQGGEGEIELKKKLVKIGKDPANDIVAGGFMVGRVAASISKRPDGYYLSFESGMSHPKVNGEKVTTSVRLREFDVIEIGNLRMKFYLK